MKKKSKKTFDWKYGAIIGLIALVFVVFAGGANGMFDFKAQLSKLLLNRIDTIIEQNLAASIEYLDEEGIELGGLVQIGQKSFPEGIIVGERVRGQTGYMQIFTDADDSLYIGSSTDATFKISNAGRITFRDINFTTSSLNWGGDFSTYSTAGSGGYYVLYSDHSTGRLGLGTSTPSYQVELVHHADVVLALTATSTNDTIIRMNNGFQAAEWLIYMDNSDNDLLKIATSSDRDIFTISAYGNVAVLKNITAASSTITNASTTRLSVETYFDVAGESQLGDTIFAGGSFSSTTAVAGTTTAANVCDNEFWELTPISATSLYLPTVTTLYADCLTANSAKKTVLVHNAGAEDTGTITITKPTLVAVEHGTDMVGTSTDSFKLGPGQWATLTFLRTSNTTTTVLYEGFGQGD